MSARDEYPWLVEFANSSGLYDASNLGFEADRALDEIDALRAELDGLRVRTLTLDQRCREASTTLLGVGAALARMGWLAADDDLSDQGHDNLLRYVRTIKGVVDVLSIGEAERQEKARIERRRVAGETGDTPQ